MSDYMRARGSIRPGAWLAAGLAVLLLTGCEKEVIEPLADPGELLERFDHDRRRHDPRKFVEVDLGEYFVTQLQRGQGTYVIRFHLFGVVDEEQQGLLATALESRRTRMRDAIIATIRKSETEHLTEPTLTWMKSELIPVINRSLQTRLLRDIVFTEFTLEQS